MSPSATNGSRPAEAAATTAAPLKASKPSNGTVHVSSADVIQMEHLYGAHK